MDFGEWELTAGQAWWVAYQKNNGKIEDKNIFMSQEMIV